MTENSKIVNLSEFNYNYVLGCLGLTSADKTAIDCTRYMYRVMGEEMAPVAPTKAALAKAIADITLEKIQARFELYKNFSEDFFKNTPSVDHDAVVMAVICDEYVNFANDPIEEPDDGVEADIANDNDEDIPPQFHDDGLDDDILTRACGIFEQAIDLETHGTLEEKRRGNNAIAFEREIYFIAHINLLGNLQNNIDMHDNLDFESINKILTIDIPAAREFIDASTDLGIFVSEQVAQAAAFFEDCLGLAVPVLPPARKGSHLRLVTP